MIRYNDLQIGVQILAEAILIPGAPLEFRASHLLKRESALSHTARE
jgi:hypothetical protein